MSVELTEAAAKRIQSQLAQRGKGVGLRLGVRQAGCSGYAYVMDYADEIRPGERVFSAHGAQVLVAPQDLPMLDGIRLDFRREGLSEAFKFDNPNAKALCGCGESFHLEKPAA